MSTVIVMDPFQNHPTPTGFLRQVIAQLSRKEGSTGWRRSLWARWHVVDPGTKEVTKVVVEAARESLVVGQAYRADWTAVHGGIERGNVVISYARTDYCDSLAGRFGS